MYIHFLEFYIYIILNEFKICKSLTVYKLVLIFK
jgi:hypothetical protein